MSFKDTPIQRKLMSVILLTSGAVLLLTCTAYFVYEFISFRYSSVRQLSILGEIIASNSTAALAFDSREDATEILTSLKAEKHIIAASLYDNEGNLFSHYPADSSIRNFPPAPGREEYRFEHSHLVGFQPVVQGNMRLGTLYLKSDMGAMYERLRLYGAIALLVIVVSFLLAYMLSKSLQRKISTPILALAETAKAISTHRDYSVRAKKLGEDELGLLTDAFNHMLMQIQEQNLALSESEARVRSVLNSAMSAVMVIDEKGLITDWNVRAEKIFGWTRQQMLGRELTETIIPLKYREAHRQGLQRFLTTGEGPVINQLLELSALRSNGEEFPAELSISVLKTGNVVAFCGFVSDITERKHAEEKIKLFNQQLEQMVTERTNELEIANKELEAFSYSVSHDLRAPLRSIHGYVNILAEEYGSKFDDEAQRLVNIILKNGQKMGQLIDDLLAFSRLGRKELVKSDASMNDIVTLIIEEHKKMDARNIINFKLLKLPIARADTTTIRQVWDNLISNAVKYSKHKEKTIIEIGSLEENDDTVTYYVKDNGAGFDMKYYNKLFGVFQRLHSENEFEGTGVGLAIVHRIVAKHGGKVWADAKVNEGATFFFSLKKL